MDCGLRLGTHFLATIICTDPSEVGLSSSLPAGSFIPLSHCLAHHRQLHRLCYSGFSSLSSSLPSSSFLLTCMVSQWSLPSLCHVLHAVTLASIISSPVPSYSSSSSPLQQLHVCSLIYVSLVVVLNCLCVLLQSLRIRHHPLLPASQAGRQSS